MKKKSFFFRNGILMLLSVVLFVCLVGFLFWNRRQEQETTQQLIQEQKVMKEDDSGNIVTESAAAVTETPTPTPEITPQITEAPLQPALSFRGDSFVSEEEQEEKGYPALMRKLLEEKNQNVAVEDYTLDAAGSLSQMKLAGVEQSILDTYLMEHEKVAQEQTLRITETKIRELSEEELYREDQNSIPVICMGYYGGWCSNPEELCDQIQQILDTYTQKEKYLILGLYPSWVEDKDAYHQAMVSRWGEHYLQLDEMIRSAASSLEGRQEIANAVYDKLTQMGYL